MSVFKFPSAPTLNRMACFGLLLAATAIVAACSGLDKTRKVTDVVVANKKNLNLRALIEAETERQRIRKLRCHSPLLSPSIVSEAALHPRLGPAWVAELLRDCPEYGAFVNELVLQRAATAGVAPPGQPGQPGQPAETGNAPK